MSSTVHRLMALAGLVCALVLLAAGPARADSTQTSIMQDDQFLIDSPSPKVISTLARMQQLGVETVRVNLEWASIAPAATSHTAPTGFDLGDANAANPASYPSGAWAPYDRLAELAPLYGITVQFNVTGPGPLWAMGKGSPTTRASTHWEPNATDFYDFVYAVGSRFSGHYEGLPAVNSWSIWNEPNQPGWLAPQWLKVGKKTVAESPRYYRSLVDSAYEALAFSGHTTKTDTILVGETAPEGKDSGGFYTAMTPIPFLRTLYCVNAKDKPLRGAAATAVGCPKSGKVAAFRKANAGLFDATGFAHHPYDFFESPTYSQKDVTEAPLSDISRLETFLNATFSAYGVHRKIPLYFTEYGYETKPPDPHQHISLAAQAAYLNEADYMSYGNARVRSVAQFLLYDSAPNPLYTKTQYDYWNTFQTGLLYLGGAAKPSLAAYRMPIWLPQTHVAPGTTVKVWGQVRAADRRASQSVKVQWKAAKGKWRTLITAHTRAQTGYFTTHVKLPGSGYVRSLWSGTAGSSTDRDALTGAFSSRSVAVLVKRPS
jgi:hypothetical protein